MSIIIKYLLRNLREKKFRTFLIIFSVMVSAALFFASSAISGTIERIYIDRMRAGFGSADIIIAPGQKSPSSYFNTNQAETMEKDMEYIIGIVNGRGTYRYDRNNNINLNIRGIDFDDLQRMNPIIVESEYELQPFEGSRIIIGKSTADKYNLKAGDYMDIEINKFKRKFVISGIAAPAGFFAESGTTVNCVVPRETLASIYDAKGMVNQIYLKPRLKDDTKRLIQELSKKYINYVVRETITQDEIKRSSSGLTSAFMFMLMVVVFMSIFIIYTSFKVITMERLPVIGTFRSIGATKKSTTLLLLGESLAYGVIGGLLGCFLGIGVLYLIALGTMPTWMQSSKVTLDFTPVQFVLSFIMAVALSAVSALIPIMRTGKFSIKDIILNQIEAVKYLGKRRLVIVIVLAAAALICPQIKIRKLGFLLDVITMVSVSVITVLLVPYITEGFIRVFERIFSLIFGNEGLLAAKNLRNNKNILNNIALLAIGISTLLMINILSSSVQKEVLNAYKEFNFDIMMYTPMVDSTFETQLQRIDGVERVYGLHELFNTKIDNSQDEIGVIQGVNRLKFLDFLEVNFEDNPNEILDDLDKGRYIVVATPLRDRLSLKKGDNLTLLIGNNKRTYQVIGFMKSMRQNGSYGLVSERYLKLDMGNNYLSDIYIKTSRPVEEVVNAIKGRFSDRALGIATIDQLLKDNEKSNSQMFGILTGFSVMALVIGIFGVLNNFLISFIERKRSLAILRSVGMSKMQIIKMIFVEALSGGTVGGTLGILSGYMISSFVSDSHIILEVAVPIPMHYSASLFLVSGLSGVLITLIASIGPALKSSKLNIIEAIKYE